MKFVYNINIANIKPIKRNCETLQKNMKSFQAIL